jgi:ABC-type sugar transport system substrate-binding protein
LSEIHSSWLLTSQSFMTRSYFKKWLVLAIASMALAGSAAAAIPIKNIVLVHGAFVDGSG